MSLSPAATEMLFLLGAGGDLVGRSAGCDFPEGARRVPVVADSGSVLTAAEVGRIAGVRPGVVLRPEPAGARGLGGIAGVGVVTLSAGTVEGVLDDVGRVGAAVGRGEEAVAAVVGLRERMFAAAEYVNPFDEGLGVLFVESVSPLRVSGGWVPQMIERAGGRPLLNPTAPRAGSGAAIGPQMAERVAGPAVTVSEESAAQSLPGWVVVCGAGLGEAEAMVAGLRERAWFRATPAARAGRVVAVASRPFLRPGPGIVDGFEWLVGVLNDRPGVVPESVAWVRA